MEIYCKVTEQGLIPMYEDDYEEKKRLKVGKVVKCDITIPRNYEFHKKFAALVRLTYDNLPEFRQAAMGVHSWEDMLITIKLDLGYASTVWYGTKQVVIPKSIAFSKMDQTQFECFYDAAVDMVLNLYLRGTKKQDLLDEIESQFKSIQWRQDLSTI